MASETRGWGWLRGAVAVFAELVRVALVPAPAAVQRVKLEIGAVAVAPTADVRWTAFALSI